MSETTSTDEVKDENELADRYQNDQIVDEYDKRYASGWRRFKGDLWQSKVCKALAPVTERGTCLDIPCGTGYLTEVLHGEFETTVACDVSPFMVRKALTKVPARGVVTDAGQPGFPESTFDCVVNNRFLVHFGHEDRKRFLVALARVSRRYLLINYNHRYTFKHWLRRLRRALGGAKSKDKLYKKCSWQEIRDEADAAGLRIVKTHRPLLGYFFLSERLLILFEKKSATAD